MPDSALFSDLSTALDRSLPISLSVQLRGLIEYGIACGELAAGTRLPSVRELAEAGGIAPMTAAGVYKELREAGLIVARAGSGTFVADGVRPTVSTSSLSRIEAHLEAALAEAEAAAIPLHEVTRILNAMIGRGRTRDGKSLRLVMVGVFTEATRAYAAEIATHLKPGDSIGSMTVSELRAAPEGVTADVYVTLANRKAEVEELVAGRAPTTSVSFIPADLTRSLLAGLNPLARVGLVTVFPEFLALMKPGVRRFAPHVASLEAIVVDDPAMAKFLERVDTVVYATGAEAVLARLPAGVEGIEYRHMPDPHAIRTGLLPLLETIRTRAAPIDRQRREIP